MLEFFLVSLLWLATPQTSSAELTQARALFDQRRFAEAAQVAQRVRTANPEALAAWKLAGLSLQLAQQLPQATTEFITALQRFPQDAELWFDLARVHYLQGSLKPAQQAAERALALRADYADAHTQLALALDALNESESALTHYRRAIALNRTAAQPNGIALRYASLLLEKLGSFEEALAYVEQSTLRRRGY